ncbi:dirigent protein 25-like [Magnolia sinica]|uniref:dirigent protein 25-like n=1 Tax=Magnolia sinica TaxID=86752 RepID=UPI00265A04B9|nr:dirigent protein 25-like [Magnolia sinica]
MAHLKAAFYLLLLAISITFTNSARILDEEVPPTGGPVVSPVVSNAIAPPVVVPTQSSITSPVLTQPGVGGPTTSSATVADADPHHTLSFFMHDIIGGTNPTARAVTGIVSNSAINGQLAFAKPNGAVLPINGGVPLTNSNNAVINNNNIPFLTGLGGQTTTTVIQNNGNNIAGSNGLPFVNGGQLPAGTTLQSLLFGTMTVIDDELTEGHELGSVVVGKAQGFYVASSEDGTSQTMAFTVMFESGHYIDTLSFFGVHRTMSSESQLAIMGGTGKYVNAKGYATAQTIHQVDQHTTDGVETLLHFTVYLSY